MKFPDSGRYHGQFFEGERHGQGSYIYPNGIQTAIYLLHGKMEI